MLRKFDRMEKRLATGSTKQFLPATTGVERAFRGRMNGAMRAKRTTRIQREKCDQILDAALDVFSARGFRGATIDQIADAAAMSKPNLLYYFASKQAMHRTLIAQLLDTWLAPLAEMNANGDPLEEIRLYVRRKLEMARDYPRESRLFANEVLHGAPHIRDLLENELRILVADKSRIIQRWIEDGKIADIDPVHLIFSIWATTQHYADFDVLVRAVLGPRRGGKRRFDDASRALEMLYTSGLTRQ
jgi:TetR/AcrR family transcriptional regulator